MLELQQVWFCMKKSDKSFMAKIFVKTWLKNNSLFLMILGIGLFFRSLFMFSQGFGNDELSAWHRTNLFDWNSFWNEGVKVGDMHPAFYQVLLWVWVRLFGDSEFAIRSTSILFYITNSYLIYFICKEFFTKRVGLMIVSVYAGLTFFIINTVFARPYNSGVLFLLLLFLGILKLASADRKKNKWLVIISVGFIGAMLSHYFAFLTAGIIGFLGVVYLVLKNEKKKILNYNVFFLIAGGMLAVILFIPHIPITIYQLNKGGLGWLQPPKWNWLIDVYIQIANSSIFVAILFILGVFYISKNEWFKKQSLESYFAVSIFILTYIVAHILSLTYTPILRELITLFLIPFLLIFLFNSVNAIKSDVKFNISIIVFPLILGIHSIYFNNLLKPFNFAVFKEIGAQTNYFRNRIDSSKYEIKSNFSNVNYLNYYLDSPINETIENWSDANTLYELNETAKKSQKQYFFYNWSNSFNTPMFYEVIRNHFPSVYSHKDYFGSAFNLFSKKGKRKLQNISEELEIKKIKPLETKDEFFGEIKFTADRFLKIKKPYNYLLIKSKGKLEGNSTLNYVAVLERNGELLVDNEIPFLYQAFDQSKLIEVNKETEFYIAFDLPEKTLETDIIKVYFWNPNRLKCKLKSIDAFIIDPNN